MYTQTAFSKWGGGPTGQLSISAVLMVLYLLALITSYFSVFIYFIFFKGSIAMHCILLPSNILRVIWIFTLQWGGRFAPHSWDRPDWAHCSWFDCSILKKLNPTSRTEIKRKSQSYLFLQTPCIKDYEEESQSLYKCRQNPAARVTVRNYLGWKLSHPTPAELHSAHCTDVCIGAKCIHFLHPNGKVTKFELHTV